MTFSRRAPLCLPPCAVSPPLLTHGRRTRAQAIRRCDDAAIHIEEVRGKYGIALRLAMPYGFYEALEKLEQLEQMVLFLAKKADSFRPGALGKEGKKRDPHFGQKMVSWRANVHSFDPASAVDVPSDH